ncbi:MAG: hypothetical protein HFG09_06535 [Oscillibacter sp.]|nr:hypothetical protein [Oscillibacter sp.]
MSDILCVYYSRTGHTKQAMEEIAQALDAELAEISDGMDRSGALGVLRSGLDAMRRTTRPIKSFQPRRPLESYRLVIVGSPIWAGRCSSVVRGFLKQYGKMISNAAYVVTRGSEDRNEDVFDQMDLYTPCGHQAAVSLRKGSVGYAFWEEEFLRQVREFLK